MKKLVVFYLIFVLACSTKFKDVTMNDNFHTMISDSPEIIATQFKDEGIDKVQVMLLDDPRYNNAFLLNDSIYFDYYEVNRAIAKFKISSGKDYKLSIIQDTGKIKELFETYKTVYSGQNRLINWMIH